MYFDVGWCKRWLSKPVIGLLYQPKGHILWVTDGVRKHFILLDSPLCSRLPLAKPDENEASVYRVMRCICYALPHLPAIVWLL